MTSNDVIDWAKAKELHGDDEQTFKDMLSQYEELAKFDETLERIYKSFTEKNYPELRSAAHFLKGSSAYTTSLRSMAHVPVSYAAATKLSDACKDLQFAAESKVPETMLKCYVALMKAAKDVKAYLGQYFNKPANLNPWTKYRTHLI